jgi:vacuolar protein sorting-associated protein 45
MDIVSSSKEGLSTLFKTISGLKVLILDTETLKIINLVFTPSELMEYEIFLFEALNGKRVTIHEMTAICLLRATKENVDLLIEKIAQPKYSTYHLVFTNLLSDAILESLALADCNSVIVNVYEYYIDYLPLQKGVLLLHPHDTIHSLASVLISLKKRPIIRYQRSSNECCQIAKALHAHINKNRELFHSSRDVILLLTDRSSDPITPLLTPWTYQAMIHELIEISLNQITINQTQYSLSDKFYLTHSHQNWGQLCLQMSELLKQFNLKDIKDIATTDDIKDFIGTFSEYNQLKNDIAKHLAITDYLSTIIKEQNLLDVALLEQEIVSGTHNTSILKLQEALHSKTISHLYKFKLVLLYTFRYHKDPHNQLSELLKILNDDSVLKYLKRYGSTIESIEEKGIIDLVSEKLNQPKGNLYEQYRPLLKRILEEFSMDILNERSYPYYSDRGKSSEVVVFMVGGLTYKEIAEVSRSNVILMSTSIHNSKSFLMV